MTFAELASLEPQLGALLREASRIDVDSDTFCANAVWYRRFKPRLLLLVGWEAESPRLRSSEAYDIAYETLYEALPDCRHKSSLLCL
jgi:hypothetical protein